MTLGGPVRLGEAGALALRAGLDGCPLPSPEHIIAGFDARIWPLDRIVGVVRRDRPAACAVRRSAPAYAENFGQVRLVILHIGQGSPGDEDPLQMRFGRMDP